MVHFKNEMGEKQEPAYVSNKKNAMNKIDVCTFSCGNLYHMLLVQLEVEQTHSVGVKDREDVQHSAV